MSTEAVHNLEAITALIKSDLKPQVQEIDQQGVYPASFLHALGQAGGFNAVVPTAQGGPGYRLLDQINIISAVGRQCGSTAFLTWCQSVSAYYLLHSPNEAVRQQYLGPVSQGELLCGTGMSNTVKHLAGIEKLHLKAHRQGEQYVVNGILPWVSNFGEGHAVILTAQLEDESGYVMFLLNSDTPGATLHGCPPFSGMEGTSTFNVRFNDVVVERREVVAHPEQFHAFIQRIKPGFVLSQAGMGFGVVESALDVIHRTDKTHAHVNVYLDQQGEDIHAQLDVLKTEAAALAAQVDAGDAPVLEVLKLRARASELALSVTQSAALHAGARGYQLRHPAQRNLREAIFVAIVTPALKHLRKEINDIEATGHVKAGAAVA